MIDVTVERELPFPVDQVWGLLANFGDLTWTKGWSKLETEGEGIGMIRRVILPGIDPIEEKLESMDHTQRRYSYTIPKMPMPVSDYRADVSVVAAGDAATRVIWHCTAVADGASDEGATQIMQDTYAMLLNWAEEALAAQA
jgi:hypothetical protein